MGPKNKSTGRVVWTSEQFNVFVDICARGTTIGKRSGGGWGDKGWLWVENEIKLAGVKFTKEQLKHKWDWMKDQWKLWKDLKGKETGLGWDPSKGTIAASDEWWHEKIKENPSFARFRERGIGQELYEKYEIIFDGTVATGEFAYTPSSGVTPNYSEHIELDNYVNLINNEELEENFEDSLDEMMNSGSVLGSSSNKVATENVCPENTKNLKKHKRVESSIEYATKKGKFGKEKKESGATIVSNTVKELQESMKESMEKKTTLMQNLLGDRPGCSIEEIMKDVLSLPLIEEASELHFFSTLLLDNKSKREMYHTFQDTETKQKWLGFHYNLWKQGLWKPQ